MISYGGGERWEMSYVEGCDAGFIYRAGPGECATSTGAAHLFLLYVYIYGIEQKHLFRVTYIYLLEMEKK